MGERMPVSQTRRRGPSAQLSSEKNKAHRRSDEVFPPLSISLKPFLTDGTDRSLRQLIYSLVSLSGLMQRNRDYFAAYIGVSSAQLMMMAVIAEAREATVSTIAERLEVSSQFVTMEVNKLIGRDLLQRRPNETDRRSSWLSLTDKARTLLLELGPVRRQTNDITFRSLDESRAQALQSILSDLVMDARSAVHELESPQMKGQVAPSVLAEIEAPRQLTSAHSKGSRKRASR